MAGLKEFLFDRSRSFSPEGIERTGEEMRIQSPGREKTQEAESRPPERPPKKLVLNGETGKGKPRAPSPPRCSTPELPPPPPPPPRDEDVISCDDPLPPPPSPGQVRSLLHASPTLAMYHKDSYMAHRKERMMYSTSFEERYGRRTIAPASHTGPSLHPTRTSMSPSAWEKYHNIRQQSTTVVFTSAELEALKEKERRLKEAKQRLLLTGSGCGNTSSPSLKSLGANSPSPPPTYLRQASSPLPANAESFFPTSSSPKRTRSDEEEECLRLSRDLISHLPDDDRLHRLLMPWSGEKTSADYVVGLFQVPSDLDEGNRRLHGRPPRTRKSKSNIPQVIGSDVAKAEGLPADSSYFTTSEEKAKFFSHYWSDLKVHDQVKIEDSKELLAKKEELLQRIEEKLGVLREERKLLEEETIGNEALGRNITIKVQALAQQREKDKFIRHLEEIEKITSLLLGLSGRLARAENALNESRSEERKTLESKREKLKEQLEEAKHLKEGIDRRSKQIALFLAKYLTVEELADYDHFVKMKAKLIMDSREMEEKIKLGEEQLNALKDALNPNK
ncbi:unnamed protein product [Darwinula stevensoni]|uniref:ASD2 domain-containing protein n=1 Tax=Darwinula stevensoni TaxID=69355 RepID=A0A7R8XHE3_9CRUS|nr:unnamed protein product [Darwinula stevensoni]CAG0890347.1 unnamed protein product [Darwinula stevensoni]